MLLRSLYSIGDVRFDGGVYYGTSYRPLPASKPKICKTPSVLSVTP